MSSMLPFPPPHDRTPNEESIQELEKKELKEESDKKRYWEKKTINILFYVFAAVVVFYTTWHFFLK